MAFSSVEILLALLVSVEDLADDILLASVLARRRLTMQVKRLWSGIAFHFSG